MSGRVIREYVYEGWNEDAEGRKLFDGMHTHTGSGRLFQNIRVSPRSGAIRASTRSTSGRRRTIRSPFPRAGPVHRRIEGLWKRPTTDPLVIHTHTEGDYWVRHVSLTHTDPQDASDVEIPENARMYHLTGSAAYGAAGRRPHLDRPADREQHVGVAVPARGAYATRQMGNGWHSAARGAIPKPAETRSSRPDEVLAKYPKIPGVSLPKATSRLPRYNYGPDFDSRGIMTVLPARAGSRAGISRCGFRISTAMATLSRVFAIRMSRFRLAPTTAGRFAGRIRRGRAILEYRQLRPFRSNQAERLATGDPRPSIEERYPSHEAYIDAVSNLHGACRGRPDAPGRRRSFCRCCTEAKSTRSLGRARTAHSGADRPAVERRRVRIEATPEVGWRSS